MRYGLNKPYLFLIFILAGRTASLLKGGVEDDGNNRIHSQNLFDAEILADDPQ